MSDSDKDQKLEKDFEYSRATYYELIEKGKESLELAIRVAEETEHPRAIEVLGQMLKHTSEVNGQLMDLNKKQRALIDKQEQLLIDKQQNNIFIASTTELQRMLRDDMKEVIEDATEKDGQLPR
tara:strand:- start:472 stop:843 length:372 start_codon:yes stop_codon:yes gene_type:complete